jgi:hypothetical protein
MNVLAGGALPFSSCTPSFCPRIPFPALQLTVLSVGTAWSSFATCWPSYSFSIACATPPPHHTHYLDLHLPCALLQCLHSNIFSMSHFAFDGVNTLSFAFDGTTAVSTFRLKRVQTFALFLIVAGCCVVGAASLKAGIYQAEGASNFEQLALAIMVYRWPPLLSRSKGLSHCRSLKCFRRTGRLRGSIKK